jgi:hypothetical protein
MSGMTAPMPVQARTSDSTSPDTISHCSRDVVNYRSWHRFKGGPSELRAFVRLVVRDRTAPKATFKKDARPVLLCVAPHNQTRFRSSGSIATLASSSASRIASLYRFIELQVSRGQGILFVFIRPYFACLINRYSSSELINRTCTSTTLCSLFEDIARFLSI